MSTEEIKFLKESLEKTQERLLLMERKYEETVKMLRKDFVLAEAVDNLKYLKNKRNKIEIAQKIIEEIKKNNNISNTVKSLIDDFCKEE